MIAREWRGERANGSFSLVFVAVQFIQAKMRVCHSEQISKELDLILLLGAAIGQLMI